MVQATQKKCSLKSGKNQKHFQMSLRRNLELVPQKVPELIVPNLTECDLKPYVSYATKEIYQEELTSKDLFNVIYGRKIIEDFKSGKLDAEGNPLEPSKLESFTPEEAEVLARQTGSDIFVGGEPYSKTFALKYDIG